MLMKLPLGGNYALNVIMCNALHLEQTFKNKAKNRSIFCHPDELFALRSQ